MEKRGEKRSKDDDFKDKPPKTPHQKLRRERHVEKRQHAREQKKKEEQDEKEREEVRTKSKLQRAAREREKKCRET